jgi:hypothetical protein
MRGEGGQLLGEALSAVRSRRPSRQRGSRAGTGQQAAGPSTARSDQSMRPHAWVVTHSVGPGAPWFVCLSVRLRSDLVRRSFGDRSGATAGASLRSDPAPPSRQTRRSGRSADGGDDPPRAEDVRSLRARRGAAAPPPVEVRDSEGIAMSLTGAWRIVEMDLWILRPSTSWCPAASNSVPTGAVGSGSLPYRGGWTAIAASATGARTSSSPGKATTTAIPPAAVAGQRWRKRFVAWTHLLSPWRRLGLPSGARRGGEERRDTYPGAAVSRTARRTANPLSR